MPPNPERDWKDILKNIAWYVWLALAPLLKAYFLKIDADAAAHADADPSNKLKSPK